MCRSVNGLPARSEQFDVSSPPLAEDRVLGGEKGGVQGALFLANENRLDWLWERVWFQLYWRQAYCVNAIPPTTTTLSSVYSLWHVFSSITFCCALFLSFPFFKFFLFPDPGIKQKESGLPELSCNRAYSPKTFIFDVGVFRHKIACSLTRWACQVRAAGSHVIIIISLTTGPFYNLGSLLKSSLEKMFSLRWHEGVLCLCWLERAVSRIILSSRILSG